MAMSQSKIKTTTASNRSSKDPAAIQVDLPGDVGLVADSSSSSDEEEPEKEPIKNDEITLPSIEELQSLTSEELQELFNKNTPSFRCLAQVLLSRSSLMRSAIYFFPPLEDPGVDKAFNYQGTIIIRHSILTKWDNCFCTMTIVLCIYSIIFY